jgi:4a-hydroxytetrahydrobiopterin dehydratase
MKRRKLEAEQIEAALARLPGWTIASGQLHRELRFASFAEAFAFMTSLALVSEAMNHHPDWRNVYDRVVIDLSTHDVSGITELDLEWARRAEAAAARFAAK